MQMQANDNLTLYRQTLGDAFDNLPQVLKTFHAHPDGAAARGTLRITRGQGWLRQTMASLMRLPASGEQVPVLLNVQVNAGIERWSRQFGSLRLVTRQWLWQGLLIETAGPLRFGFRLSANATEMRFDFARCWLLGMPLPFALAPRVNARASEYEDGWWIHVCVEVPVLGMLAQYEGKVVPEC